MRPHNYIRISEHKKLRVQSLAPSIKFPFELLNLELLNFSALWTRKAESRNNLTPMVTWKDHRPPLEQVKSGFKIAGAILLTPAAFILFSKGYTLLPANLHRQVTLGWTLLIVTAAALLVTVRYWAPIFFAVVAYCALRSSILVVLIVVGLIRDIKPWSTVALCISLWLMTAASYRFHDRKVFSIVDQFALTSAVMLLFLALMRIATSGVNASVLPFAVALLVLAVPVSFGLIHSSRSKL